MVSMLPASANSDGAGEGCRKVEALDILDRMSRVATNKRTLSLLDHSFDHVQGAPASVYAVNPLVIVSSFSCFQMIVPRPTASRQAPTLSK